MQKTILVPLAKGFEEIELVSVVDLLRRAELKVVLASINAEKIIAGAHNISLKAEKLMSEIELNDFDGIVLAGGLNGMLNLKASTLVLEALQNLHKKQKLIAAICAAPVVLAQAGVLEGAFTCYSGFEKEIKASYVKKAVLVDKNIITAASAAFALDFALALVAYLCGEESVKKLKKELLLDDFQA